MLAGRPPLCGDTVLETLDLVRTQAPEPPSKLNNRVPHDLEVICLKCLEKDPRRRYSSAEALAADLRRWLDGEPITARAVPAWERAVLWAKRRPAIAGLLTLSAAALIALFVGGIVFNRKLQAANTELNTANVKLGTALADATTQRNSATAQRDRALRRLYALRYRQAREAYDADRIGTTREILASLGPDQNDGLELRGFEWYYLDRLCRQELVALRGNSGPITAVAVSPDGRRVASASSYPRNEAGESSEIRLWDAASGRLLHTLGKLPVEVSWLSFSPDGQRLWSVSSRRTISNIRGEYTYLPSRARIWDVVTGGEVAAFTGEDRAIHFAFSPDGRLVAGILSQRAAGEAGGWGELDRDRAVEIRVWETATGAVARSITLPPGSPAARVDFTPDGRHLRLDGPHRADYTPLWVKHLDVATGLEDPNFEPPAPVQGVAGPGGLRAEFGDWRRPSQTVRVFEGGAAEPMLTLKGHEGEIRCAAFSGDGRLLATGADDWTIRLWDTAARRDLLRLRVPMGTLNVGPFVADGGRLVTRSTTEARAWDLLTGQQVRRIGLRRGGEAPMAFRLAPGRFLIARGADRAINLWDMGAEEPTVSLADLPEDIRSGDVSPDGRSVAAISGVDLLKVWDTSTRREWFSLALGEHPLLGPDRSSVKLEFSPGGRHLALFTKRAVVVWAMNPGQIPRVVLEASDPDREPTLSFGPDDRRLAIAWGRPLDLLFSAGRPAPVGPTAVEVWDLTNGRRSFVREVPRRLIAGMLFSPVGDRLAVSMSMAEPSRTAPSGPIRAGLVEIWDARTGRDLTVLQGAEPNHRQMAFSPDGQRLAIAAGPTVQLWDALSGQELLLLTAPRSDDSFSQVLFSPDGRRLAALGADGINVATRVWETQEVPAEIYARREALALVRSIYEDLWIKEEVKEQIRNDATLRAALRRDALAEADRFPADDAADLVEQCRFLLMPGVPGPPFHDLFLLRFHQAEVAHRIAPDDAETRLVLGAVRYWQQQYLQAFELLTRAVEAAPESFEGLGFLGMTHARLGRSDQARRIRDRLQAELDGPLGEPDRALRAITKPMSERTAAEMARYIEIVSDPRYARFNRIKQFVDEIDGLLAHPAPNATGAGPGRAPGND